MKRLEERKQRKEKKKLKDLEFRRNKKSFRDFLKVSEYGVHGKLNDARGDKVVKSKIY